MTSPAASAIKAHQPETGRPLGSRPGPLVTGRRVSSATLIADARHS